MKHNMAVITDKAGKFLGAVQLAISPTEKIQ